MKMISESDINRIERELEMIVCDIKHLVDFEMILDELIDKRSLVLKKHPKEIMNILDELWCMYDKNMKQMTEVSECCMDLDYINIEELMDKAISLFNQSFSSLKESVRIFEKSCKRYGLNCDGDFGELELIIDNLDEFFEHVGIRRYINIELEELLKYIKARWLERINMVCVYAPPELMSVNTFNNSDDTTYPTIHAFTENESGEDESDDTYMKELYGSPDMFRKQ